MPSTTLVEVGVGGGWGFRSRVRPTYQKLDPQMKSNLTFSVRWVGGDLENKANLDSSCS